MRERQKGDGGIRGGMRVEGRRVDEYEGEMYNVDSTYIN
jgi:hypothetical protein